MVANIFVFTSPTCSHCHHTMSMLKGLDRKDIRIKEISTSTEEGVKLARENEITSVPAVFVSCENSEEVIGLRGAPSESEINKAVDVCLGKDKF